MVLRQGWGKVQPRMGPSGSLLHLLFMSLCLYVQWSGNSLHVWRWVSVWVDHKIPRLNCCSVDEIMVTYFRSAHQQCDFDIFLWQENHCRFGLALLSTKHVRVYDVSKARSFPLIIMKIACDYNGCTLLAHSSYRLHHLAHIKNGCLNTCHPPWNSSRRLQKPRRARLTSRSRRKRSSRKLARTYYNIAPFPVLNSSQIHVRGGHAETARQHLCQCIDWPVDCRGDRG